MNEIKAIMFDLDNTLYDFKFFWELANSELYKSLNINEVNYDEFMVEYLKQDEVLWQDLVSEKITLTELRTNRPYITFKNLKIDKSIDFCKDFYIKMFNILVENIVLDKQIEKILFNLKENYKLYILTNGFTEEQERKISKLNISKYFERIFISESIGYEKPAKEAFEYITKSINIPPENILMIGDSYTNDIESAINNGFNALHINYNQLSNRKYDFEKDILEQLSNEIRYMDKK